MLIVVSLPLPVCVQQTRKTLDHLAGAEFVARAFGGSSKVSGEAMVNSILAAFRETLGHLPWMDKESSKAAQRKADNVIAKVGYPLYPNTTSSVALRAYYGRQAVTDDFLLNAVASNQMELQRAWQQQLGNLRNRDSWLMAADEVYVTTTAEVIGWIPADVPAAPLRQKRLRKPSGF